MFALFLGTAYTMTVTSCSEIDEPVYVTSQKSSEANLASSASRNIVHDSINTYATSSDLTINDSIINIQSDITGVPIKFFRLYNGNYSCTVQCKTIILTYTSFDEKLLPPSEEIDEEGNRLVEIICARSGVGSTVGRNNFYKVTKQDKGQCEVRVGAYVCVSQLGIEHWELHSAYIKFDGTHSAHYTFSSKKIDVNSLPKSILEKYINEKNGNTK